MRTALFVVKLMPVFVNTIGIAFLMRISFDMLVLTQYPLLGVFWLLVLVKVFSIRLVRKTQGVLDFRIGLTEAQLDQLIKNVDLRLI